MIAQIAKIEGKYAKKLSSTHKFAAAKFPMNEIF